MQLPFIVMEYVEGRLLKDIIHDGPLEPDAAVRIIDGVLTALEYSHRAGVVHRDIKPGNIMITTTGQVKVMDFGIARAVSDSSTTVAQTTAILGTASYFSPEQAKGETVDARTDLYSTGVVLFEMLTGRPPFRGDTPVAVAYQHVSERPVKPSVINPKVSPALDAVVLHALAKNRDKRYQTAAEFRADVDTAASGRVPVHRQPDEAAMLFGAPTGSLSTSELALRQLTEDETMTRTQRRPPAIWIWSGIIGVIVIVIAVMYWAFNLQPTDELPSNAREVPTLAGLTLRGGRGQLQELGLPADAHRGDERHGAGRPGHPHRPGRGRDRRHRHGRHRLRVDRAANRSPCPTCGTSRSTRRRPTSRRPASTPGTETPRELADRRRRHRARHDARGRQRRPRPAPTVDFRISSGLVTLPTSRARRSPRHPRTSRPRTCS